MALGVLACACGPHHLCIVAGTPVLADGGAREVCKLEMYIGDREDPLFSQSVYSGEPFEIRMSVAIIEPALPHHAEIHCPGYQVAATGTFKIGAGWAKCSPVRLGEIELYAVEPTQEQGPAAGVPHAVAPPNEAMHQTGR